MILDTRRFLEQAGLEPQVLDVWIEDQWLVPSKELTGMGFSRTDIARVSLIRHLKFNMDINDEGIGVILHLIDQLYGMREALSGLNIIVNQNQSVFPNDMGL